MLTAYEATLSSAAIADAQLNGAVSAVESAIVDGTRTLR